MNIRVTDFKQFIYCPRIIYYTYVEPVPRKTSFKMTYGRVQHQLLNQKEKRRNLSRYGLDEGRRHFGYPVKSETLGFEGKLDILIETEENSETKFIPVECKDTDLGIYNNIKYQLAAYCICLEEMTETKVDYGYIYLIPKDEIVRINISDDERLYVKKMITMIKQIIFDEYYPEPRSRKRCWDCEFRNYCNDLDICGVAERKERNLKLMKELFKKVN